MSSKNNVLPFLLFFFPPFLFAQTSQPEVLSLDSFLQENIWNLSQEELIKRYPFQWLDRRKTKARLMPQENLPKKIEVHSFYPTVGNQRVGETLINFEEGNLSAVTISFYNKADNPPLDKDTFDSVIQNSLKEINLLTGIQGKEMGRNKESIVRARGYSWTTAFSLLNLEYSFLKKDKNNRPSFQAEFITLRITPKTATKSSQTPQRVKKRDLPKNLVKEGENVFIDGIPMVDQGERSYCAVASVQRIMEYYGLPIDQHELAQVAGSDAKTGTSIQILIDALKKIRPKTKLNLKEHAFMSPYKFERFSRYYNRLARKEKKELIKNPKKVARGEVPFTFDGALFKEARLRQKSDYTRFQKDVVNIIDKGIPILWSVGLGLVPEPIATPQSQGSHIRLLIGYNKKENTILYTDSWGKGHERKKLPMEDAYTITLGMHTLEPFR